MKRTTVSIVLLAIMILAAAHQALAGVGGNRDLPDASEVIERYVDALGGRAAIDNLATRVCVGRLIHDLNWQTPTRQVVPFAAYAADQGKVLMVEHTADGVRCEGSDGEVTWVQDASGVTLKDEPFRAKTAWLIDPRNAIDIGEYFPDLEVTSERSVDDQVVYVVESPELDPAHYALLFDVETGLLIGIGYYWYLRDYSEIDGVKFPHEVVMSRKGGSSTFVFDLVAHNLPLDGALFAVPGAGPWEDH